MAERTGRVGVLSPTRPANTQTANHTDRTTPYYAYYYSTVRDLVKEITVNYGKLWQ